MSERTEHQAEGSLEERGRRAEELAPDPNPEPVPEVHAPTEAGEPEEPEAPPTRFVPEQAPPPQTQGRRKVRRFGSSVNASPGVGGVAGDVAGTSGLSDPVSNGTQVTGPVPGSERPSGGPAEPPAQPPTNRPPTSEEQYMAKYPQPFVPTTPLPPATGTEIDPVAPPDASRDPQPGTSPGYAGLYEGSVAATVRQGTVQYPDQDRRTPGAVPGPEPSDETTAGGSSNPGDPAAEDGGEGGLTKWLPRNRRGQVLVGLAAVVLLAGLFGGVMTLLSASEESPPETVAASNASGGEQGAQADGVKQEDLLQQTPGGAQLTPGVLPVVDTGVVFEPLPQKADGEVTLRASGRDGEEYVWDGTIEAGSEEADGESPENSDGEGEANGDGDGDGNGAGDSDAAAVSGFDTLLLEGQTYADFSGGFGLPEAELRDGEFAWAVPGGLVVRAEYDSATEGTTGDDESDDSKKDGAQAEPPRQEADGSFKVLEEASGELLLSGTYSDVRRPGSDKVVRTYIEREPGAQQWQTYRRGFEAPPDTPIPLLVGWEEPPLKENSGSSDAENSENNTQQQGGA